MVFLKKGRSTVCSVEVGSRALKAGVSADTALFCIRVDELFRSCGRRSKNFEESSTTPGTASNS